MIRRVQIAAMAALLLGSAGAAQAGYRYEPPDLGPDYDQPVTQTPAPRTDLEEYIDVGVLVAALALASYLALWRRSRKGIIVLAIACLLYFGWWREGCVCPIGSVQNVSQAFFGREVYIHPDRDEIKYRYKSDDVAAVRRIFKDRYAQLEGAQFHERGDDFHIRLRLNSANRRLMEELGDAGVTLKYGMGAEAKALLRHVWRVERGFAIPWPVIAFFFLPLVVTLLFGRTFCAAVCPLGAIQDVVLLRPVRTPGWLNAALGTLAYVYLALAVMFAAAGSAYVICRYDPFVSFFRLAGDWEMFALGGCFLLIGVFIGRPYCRFLCPYGAIMRVFSRFSGRRVTITPDECVRCRLCEDACPFGAIRRPTEPRPSGVRRQGKRRLVAMVILLPLLMAGGAWLGHWLRGPMSRMDATVRLAEVIHSGATDAPEPVTEADETRAEMVEAHIASGRPTEELYEEAAIIRGQLARAGMLAGAFIGLVVGLKLISSSVRRTRLDYEADRAACLACGRCFKFCPREQLRLKERRGEPAGDEGDQTEHEH